MNHSEHIAGKVFDGERALYNIEDARISDCVFAGPADGESALKEARGIEVSGCRFELRYPLWHARDFSVKGSSMGITCRAALWYSSGGIISDSELRGIKAVRGCDSISIERCRIDSDEFGWKSSGISVADSEIRSEYLFLDSKGLRMERTGMKGKYSFQYVEGASIEGCALDTKDAFWHSKGVTVRDCDVKGEYLGWYSEDLTLIDCRISGTQPFCYCKGLKLRGCTMEGCDFSFEYSDVDAEIVGTVDSVRNILSGTVAADGFGEIIEGDAAMECKGKAVVRGSQ